jgi:hypothetical protein
LPEGQRYTWRKGLVIEEIKQRYRYGAGSDNRRMIGNLSFDAKEAAPDAIAWVSKEIRLIRQNRV